MCDGVQSVGSKIITIAAWQTPLLFQTSRFIKPWRPGLLLLRPSCKTLIELRRADDRTLR